MSALIQVENISKRYRIGQTSLSLRSALAGGRWNKKKQVQHEEYHWAVKNISFALEPGEALGIIGPNGAGKTTILKILSHVTRPTAGDVHIEGRFSALIELGAGFHPDLSGRENIYLNGAILGLKKSEIKARFDEIVDFAGIGEYLDTPIKRYSSGMYARLGFSVAAHVDPRVLLVDEVLAVGDYAFQMRCYARMDELRSKGTSLIFVSHNLEAVRRVCERGLVMYRGESIFQGTAAEAVVAYSDALRKSARESIGAVPTDGGLSQRVMTFDAEVERVTLYGVTGQPATVLQSGTVAKIVVQVFFHKNVTEPIFSMTIRTPDGRLVYDTTTRWKGIKTHDFFEGERCHVEFLVNLPLLEGEYQLGVDVAASDFSHYYDRLERALGFWVTSTSGAQGLVDLDAQVSINKTVLFKQPHELSESQRHYSSLQAG